MKDGFLKAAALSPSLRVADCNYNASQIVSQLQDAAARGVRLAVFPEFCLTGYTCGDLFLQRTLQQGALDALQTVLDASRELDVVALVGLPLLVRGKLYNCAAVLCGGRFQWSCKQQNGRCTNTVRWPFCVTTTKNAACTQQTAQKHKRENEIDRKPGSVLNDDLSRPAIADRLVPPSGHASSAVRPI